MTFVPFPPEPVTGKLLVEVHPRLYLCPEPVISQGNIPQQLIGMIFFSTAREKLFFNIGLAKV